METHHLRDNQKEGRIWHIRSSPSTAEFASSPAAKIAQQVAKTLHIHYVDKFLITEAAQKSGVQVDRVEATDEQLASRFEYSQAEAAHYYATASSALPTTAQIAEVQFQLIRHIAEQGPCVIVGRCANHVLRGAGRRFGHFRPRQPGCAGA